MNLLLIAYILGCIAIFPRVFQFFIEDLAVGVPERVDVVLAGLMATLITAFWPGVVVGLIVKSLVLDPLIDRIIKEYKENR